MNNIKKIDIFLISFLFISIISLFLGFFFNEDLSTGGSRWDFNQTWNVVIDFSNFKFHEYFNYTSHVPFHYMLLSVLYKLFDDQYIVRLIYLIFSFSLPFLLYLNLNKIYNCQKSLLLFFCFSLILFPFFRAMSIWPNAHLTASIFFLISNYFYLKGNAENKLLYKYLNLLFLALATYTMQSYVILFFFYLINYFLYHSKKDFLQLFLFCIFLAIPGLYLISFNTRISNVTITKNFSYSLASNISLITFYLLFLTNAKNLDFIKSKIIKLSKKEILIIIALFVYTVMNFTAYDNPMIGGGFFYKLSHLLFNNNLIFFSSFLLGLFLCAVIVKEDRKFIYPMLIIIIMASNYIVFQKYYEPLFILLLSVLYKNYFIKNLLLNLKNISIFLLFVVLYFLSATINQIAGVTNNLSGIIRFF